MPGVLLRKIPPYKLENAFSVRSRLTSSMVARSGETRMLNFGVCTVSNDDRRWKALSTSVWRDGGRRS